MSESVTTNVPLLEARNIQKRFGRVIALREGTFALRPNEVHAIVGDNGAGKSTLIKIVSGVHHADGGELRLDGKPITIPSVRASRGFPIVTGLLSRSSSPASGW